MFDQFPKKRKALPDNYRKIYQEHYENNRGGKTKTSFLSQKMEAWMHKKVAADVSQDFTKITLEIGAGTLNQLAYEATTHYDIVEPFKALFSNSLFRNRVRNIYADIADIADNKYDRITTIATFEHVLNLPELIAMTCGLLAKGGVLRVAIPNEGHFLWKLGWKVSGIEFYAKYKLDYAVLMNYEHVNTADEIEDVLSYFYKEISCSCFGLNKKLSFYRFYECKFPKLNNAEVYLASLR